MEKFTILSNQFRLANEFLKEIKYSCRTLSSFAQALQDQINLIHFQLADIERRCLKQDYTYTILSFYQELESLGIISKGKCIERIFNEMIFYNNKPNCDLTLELIYILYKNLLMSEMINNTTFFVRLILLIRCFVVEILFLEFFITTVYIQLSDLFGNNSKLAGEWHFR